jgi:hypothetical protein
MAAYAHSARRHGAQLIERQKAMIPQIIRHDEKSRGEMSIF